MNDYISKPVKVRAVADALEKWLPRKQDGPASALSPAMSALAPVLPAASSPGAEEVALLDS
jgi:hypothetical protein